MEQYLDDSFVDGELRISTESIFSLEQDLRTHSQLERKYHRWLSEAIKEVDDISLKLEICVAEIVEEIVSRENIPPSAVQEIRRSRVAGDKRYQLMRGRLNSAIEKKEYLRGLTKAWESRGYRLMEIVKLSDRLMWNEPRVYNTNQKTTEEKLDSVGDKLSID